MRKKLQNMIFELSYLIELLISIVVGVAVLIFGVSFVAELIGKGFNFGNTDAFAEILDYAIILAIGAELIKMLCKHTPETVIEVLAYALAHQLIVGHSSALENFIMVVSISVLFAVRRFLFKRHDLVETPDGFVEADDSER